MDESFQEFLLNVCVKKPDENKNAKIENQKTNNRFKLIIEYEKYGKERQDFEGKEVKLEKQFPLMKSNQKKI